ncbi:hypothetical protein CLAIMM_04239 isoform 2 [Cladophialophora immunda]|nr:hypothetical protein CLAIMM_04239 isoform 2 [Cladophialophora immunda]
MFHDAPLLDPDGIAPSISGHICHLRGRVSALETCVRDRAFNSVQLCFKGVITSSIDSRSATENFVVLTNTKTRCDFVARQSPSRPSSSSDAYHTTDFHFAVPTVSSNQDGALRPLPPTSTITGTADVPQTSALASHRILQGKCQVSYWIEAQFLLDGRQVGYVREDVRISWAYPTLRAYLFRGSPLTVQATPGVVTRYVFQSSPDLSLTLYGLDMLIKRDCETGRPQSTLLTAALNIRSPATKGKTSFDPRQSIQCSIKAKWELTVRFTNVSAGGTAKILKAGESICKKITLSVQKTSITFRPLLSEKQDSQALSDPPAHVATSQLILSVPDGVSQPSFCFDHLSRTYALDLSFSFHNIPGVAKHYVHVKAPVMVMSSSVLDEVLPKYKAVADEVETPCQTEHEPQEIDYDVVIVGAGISGIAFAYRLQERNPDLTYCILEARHEIGGTWSLFQYPGIRSDSDLFTFGFPWRPWKERTAMASGPQITRYLKECAAQEGIDQKIKFGHHLNQAQWSSLNKIWTLHITADTAQKTLRTRFLLLGTGYYDYQKGLKVDIPGIQNFRGPVIHPQFWPSDLDYANKKIVIIGSGATAITLLPSVANSAAHVTMLQRSPSYIISVPSEDKTEIAIRFVFPERVAVSLIRYKWILTSFLLVSFCQWFPNVARRLFNSATKAQLPPGMELDPNFNPRYNPWEQRLCACPDGDFYTCLRNGTASVKTGVIDMVTSTSIRLRSGEELLPDIIITATGLKLRFGGGIDFVVDDQKFRLAGSLAWQGALLEGLPNLMFAFGYVDASWTMGAEATAQLACRLLAQMKKRNFRMIVPRQSDKEKAKTKVLPFWRLNSTYVREGNADMPRAGDRGPWRRRSYYWKDIMTACRTALFYKSKPSDHLNGREAVVPSGGILGGGSSINFMMYTRPQGIDMDSWKTPGWTAHDMLPLFKKLETFHQGEHGIDENKHGYDGPVHISSGGFRSKSGDIFMDTVTRMDFKEIVDLQDLTQVGGFSVRDH